MKRVYFVWREGVYMQGAYAVFTNLDDAKGFADYLASKDYDCYHRYNVSKMPIDEPFEVKNADALSKRLDIMYSVTKGDVS